MRVKVPDLQGKELYQFLTQHKSDLIAKKRSMPITSEPLAGELVFLRDAVDVKADESLPEDVIRVKLVGNTALFADTYLDVLAPDCWKKSVKERGPAGTNIIPHLHDHEHELSAIVGDAVSIDTEMIAVRELGYDADGMAPALVMVSDVAREYDEKTFSLYRRKKVRQHSIGFQYINLMLCINDDEYKEEFANWTAHYPSVINKEVVDQRGYFWYVTEIRLLEISAVLFGANALTPTLEVSTGPDGKSTPIADTKDQKPGELTSDQVIKSIYLTNFLQK